MKTSQDQMIGKKLIVYVTIHYIIRPCAHRIYMAQPYKITNYRNTLHHQNYSYDTDNDLSVMSIHT